MEKYLKKAAACGLLIAALCLNICWFENAYALQKFALIGADVEAMTETTAVRSVEVKETNVESAVAFHRIGDSAKYVLVFENGDKEKRISGVAVDCASDLFECELEDYTGRVLASGEKLEFNLTVKYAQGVEEISARAQDFEITVSFELEDVETGVVETVDFEIVNPSTLDGVWQTAVIFAVAMIVLLFLVANKKRGKGRVVVLAILMLAMIAPVAVMAEPNDDSEISLVNSFELLDRLSVEFVVDGVHKSLVVDYGDVLEEVEAPEKTGYDFVAWVHDGVVYDFTEPVTDDMVLVAEYKLQTKKLTIGDEEFVTSNLASGEYDYGTHVELSANERKNWTFKGWDNGATEATLSFDLTEDVTIAPVYEKLPFETVFEHEGQCTFNGTTDYLVGEPISGDNCEYAGQSHIDTGVQLFTRDNIEKDFLISFEIDEFDPAKNPLNATLMNSTYEFENVQYPGTVFRLNGSSKKEYLVGSNIVSYRSDMVSTVRNSAKKPKVNIDGTTKVAIMRKGNVYCYQINDGAVNVIHKQPSGDMLYTFDTTVYFGASSKPVNNGELTPTNFLNGKMSNMKVMLGTDVDDLMGDCHQ